MAVAAAVEEAAEEAAEETAEGAAVNLTILLSFPHRDAAAGLRMGAGVHTGTVVNLAWNCNRRQLAAVSMNRKQTTRRRRNESAGV